MSFAQGINFRATSGYVTDGTNQTFETGTTVNYPRTTPQGNTVGFESITGTLATRDRSTTPDPRIAGFVFVTANGTFTYRVDLPSPGTYRIYGGVRETVGGGLRDSKLEILDDATVLVTAWDRANLTSANTLGIDNVIYATGSAWLAAGPTYRDLTFNSTIARFRVSPPTSGTDNRGFISSIFIELLFAPLTATITGEIPVTAAIAAELTPISGGVPHGVLRRGRRGRVWQDVPEELKPVVALAEEWSEADPVQRAVEEALAKHARITLRTSAARRARLMDEAKRAVIAAVERAAELDDEEALIALL